MDTLYNARIGIEERPSYIPELLFEASADVFRDNGLVGNKHVTSRGQLAEGFDPSCEMMRTGDYEIFLRQGFDRSGLEYVREAIALGGSEEYIEKLMLLEEFLEMAEKADATLSLPVEIVGEMQLPGYTSMTLKTPCGLQGPHVHWDGGEEFTRFWKPPDEDNWYDFDVVKNFVFDRAMGFGMKDVFDIAEEYGTGLIAYVRSIGDRMKMRSERKEMKKWGDIYRTLSKSPDSVRRVDFM